MTDDARWNRDTVPASPGSPSRPSRSSAGTKIVSPFDPPARDRFEEGEELGRGGMGRVFEARDVALDRPVAIKQSLTDDLAMLARFEREALITARLQHPSIVPVLDAGRDANGRPYYVMRKIEGRPLATVVAEARDASARLALLPNMLAAVDAVAYAHARGVLHRDLKPWNILLGPFGETFVIDWGLARDGSSSDSLGGTTSSGDDGLTRVGSAMGTPGFMAPEQARGDAIDQRADVYALGATLAHLLAGKQPFAGVDPTVAIETVARDELPRIEFPDEVMPELRTIAQKAMAAKAGDRYPDAGALASDLRRFLAGQLVAAHVYTTRERLARWLRKHRLVVAIASIAVVALAAISTYAIRRVIVARDDARAAQLRADERADQMLVARADSLATTDPAFAIALLKQLAPGSRVWPRARLVAETAVAHGVGRGMRVADGSAYTRIAASPSGDVVAIFNGDTIQVVEPSLKSAARTLVDHPDGISQFWWLDAESLVVVTDKHAVLRVYRDGTTTALDAKANGKSVGLVMAHGDGKVFAQVDGSLRELDPDGGPPRAELGPVKHAQRVRGALLYSVDNKTLVVAADGAPAESFAIDLDARMVVPHLKEQRLAAYSDDDVVEYERVDGVWKERGRWIVDAHHLAYRDKVLIAVEAAGVAYLMPGRPPFREAAAISRDRSVVPGAVVVADEGVFVLGDSAIHALDGGPAEIALYTDRQTSFAKAGPYLVTMARTGVLRSWDLRRFYPRLLSMKKFGITTIDVNTDRVWFQDGDQLVVYDLASGKLERMRGAHETFDSSALACDQPDFSILKLDEQRRDVMGEPAQAAVRTRDGTITPIPGTYQFVACARPWLALKRTSAIEIRDARTPDREGRVFEATGPLDGFRVSEGWLAMIDKARTVTRVELATGRVHPTFSIGDAVGFAMDMRGRVATTTKDGSVVLWTDGKPRTVVEKLDIAAFHGHRAGFLVFTHDRSVVVIDHDARVVRYDIGEKALSIAHQAFRVAVITDGRVGVLDVRDGTLVRFPWRANNLALSSDGASIAWVKNDRGGVLRLDIPDEPRALLRWLDELSNATLAPGSTEVTWK